MNNIVIVSPSSISKDQLRRAVESLGGYWVTGVAVDNGVVEKGTSAVYVSADVGLSSLCYEQDEAAALRSFLGAEPLSAVDIHIGHGVGSPQLAKQVADHFLSLWGGFVDNNETDVVSQIAKRLEFGPSLKKV